uniref:transposase n=1 Tax=Helicobacter salomonis TaxID=56878 RepID=UPI0018F84F4C
FIKSVLEEIEESSDFIIIARQTNKDHLHLMIEYLPRVSISFIIMQIEGMTTCEPPLPKERSFLTNFKLAFLN